MGVDNTLRSANKQLNIQSAQARSGNTTEDSSSGSYDGRQGWKQLWKLKVKQKLKVFIWKGLNNALPVNELIFARTKMGDPRCTGCGEEEETVEHLFFHCKKAEHAWRIAPVQWDGIEDQRGCFKRWWNALVGARCRREGLEHIGLTVNILWQPWKARNERVYQGMDRQPLQVIQRAIQEWVEHLTVLEGNRSEHSRNTRCN